MLQLIEQTNEIKHSQGIWDKIRVREVAFSLNPESHLGEKLRKMASKSSSVRSIFE